LAVSGVIAQGTSVPTTGAASTWFWVLEPAATLGGMSSAPDVYLRNNNK
jgi:hypothetical protein